jgi:hypothetical protein
VIFIATKSFRILALLLLSSVFIMGCQTTDKSDDQDSSRIWGEPASGLRCSIIVENTHWSNEAVSDAQ